MVNERIKSVAIVSDTISVPDEDYQIEFDMAVVIRTAYNTYTFTRDWYYGESIEVNIDRERMMPYDVSSVRSDWESIQDNIAIERRTEEL